MGQEYICSPREREGGRRSARERKVEREGEGEERET